MKQTAQTPLRDFLQNSQPVMVLAGILLYALGAGIYVYRGGIIEWDVYWLGQACITLLQLSSYYLNTFYDRIQESPRRQDRINSENNRRQSETAPRSNYLLAAVTTLAIGAMVTVLLFSKGVMDVSVILFLGIAFVFSFFYGVPPLRLSARGYGELIIAILLTNITPAFAFSLQAGELLQILGMLTFPLTALYLAMILALSLQGYYQDIKDGRQTILTRLGWQRGMVLHNFLILAAYVLILLASILGLSWSLSWPRLLTLPLGIFQVWLMVQINLGAKPQWRLLKTTAVATFVATTYLLVFALWIG